MSQPQTKRLILTLRAEDYARLEHAAAAQVRAPEQQAQYIIRRALSRVRATLKNEEVPVT